jgi:hypothetical protein
MSTLFTLPKQVPLTTSAGLYPSAVLYFYVTATSTPKVVYTDADLVTPHGTSVTADANGIFAPIWLASDQQYRVTLKTSGGATVSGYPVDGVGGPIMTKAEIGATLFPQTTAEAAASVVPADYAQIPGYEARYSSIADALAQQDAGGDPVVSATGGMRLVGNIGGNTVRPEGQFIIENTTTSGHAIMSIVNHKSTEECAVEYVGYLDNNAAFQHGAQFVRWTGGDNGATTYKSVYGVHLTGHNLATAAVDNTPLIIWSNNSILLGGGDTATTKWTTELVPENWVDIYTSGRARTSFIVGPNHAYSTKTGFTLEAETQAQVGSLDGSGVVEKAIQFGYSNAGTTCYLQAYNNTTVAYAPLLFQASQFNIAQGSMVPVTNNAIDLGTNPLAWRNIYSVNAVTVTSDKRLKEDAGEITDQEYDWSIMIKRLFRKYTLKADADKKIRFGVYAQEVVEAGKQAGIDDPLAYNFIVYEGGQYGIRYDELLAFVITTL